MMGIVRASLVTGALLFGLPIIQMNAREANNDARSEIDAFNKKFTELHLKMDTPGIMAMWAEDGVDLMQGEAPLVGRKTVTAWVEDVLSKTRGYKVTKEEMEFHDVQVCGDWATEWDGASGSAGAGREAKFRRVREDGSGAAPRSWR